MLILSMSKTLLPSLSLSPLPPFLSLSFLFLYPFLYSSKHFISHLGFPHPDYGLTRSFLSPNFLRHPNDPSFPSPTTCYPGGKLDFRLSSLTLPPPLALASTQRPSTKAPKLHSNARLLAAPSASTSTDRGLVHDVDAVEKLCR